MTEGAKIGLIIGASVVVLGGGGLAIYLSGRNKKITPPNPPQTNQQVGGTNTDDKTFVDKAKNVADTAKTVTETAEILGDIWGSVKGWFGKKEEKETKKPTGSLSDGTTIFKQKVSAIGGAYGQPTDKLYSNAISVNKGKKNLFKATAIDNSKRRMRINKLGIVEFV